MHTENNIKAKLARALSVILTALILIFSVVLCSHHHLEYGTNQLYDEDCPVCLLRLAYVFVLLAVVMAVSCALIRRGVAARLFVGPCCDQICLPSPRSPPSNAIS